MLDKIKNRKDSGFTIVEVMIVLAIAGLVILIVFLAVPALQRNSRNTQRKADVSALLGAVNEYQSNNNGQNPANATALTALAKTAFYQGTGTTAGQIGFGTGTTPALTPADATNDRVVVVMGAKCTAAGGATAGPPRAAVALYLTETSNGYTQSCQEG